MTEFDDDESRVRDVDYRTDILHVSQRLLVQMKLIVIWFFSETHFLTFSTVTFFRCRVESINT